MAVRLNSDRRINASRALKLGRPLFIDVPKSAACSAITASALVLLISKLFLQPTIGLGGEFLLACAFAAWFVGNRLALILGTFIVVILFLNGQLIDFDNATIDDWIDVVFQLCCALLVVLMLGVARVALEIEWRHARLDLLTGALNRKAFFEAINSVNEDDGVAILIYADLDGLKYLNDNKGHDEGDRAIQNFAQSVRQSIRKGDIFARLGGDEFGIYLNVADKEAAHIVAERLHQTINLQREEETGLKCSFGVLVLPSGARSIDRELRYVDRLMYSAKRGGSGFSIAMLVEGLPEKLVYLSTSGVEPEIVDEWQSVSLGAISRESNRRRSTPYPRVA